MRNGVVVLALLAAACSKASDQAAQMADAPTRNEAAGPEMRVTLTPGVALTYSYSFRLPVGRVADTQEKHAMQCEALGAARCRIVAMAYHVVGSRSAAGSLVMKLAPELARGFGKQGIATVIRQGGMLSDEMVDSVEAGAAVAAADREQTGIRDERQRIEKSLAEPNLGDNERSVLQQRLADLREAKTGIANSRAEANALLASTPVTFNYASGVIDTGFADGPLLGAIKDGWANVVAGSLVILTIVISVLPWVVIGIALVWLWRRYAKRLGMSRSDEA